MAVPPPAKIKGLAFSVLGPSIHEMATVLLFLLMYKRDPEPLDTLIEWLREDGLNISGIEEQAARVSKVLRKDVAKLEKEAEA